MMKNTCILLLLCSVLLSSGCDPFGTPPPDVSTTPNAEQVDYCRSVMYLNPSIDIQPLGYYYQHAFLDDAINFKFNALTDDLANIFLPEHVPSENLVERETPYLLDQDIGEKWWDPPKPKLIGDSFTVPDPRTKGARGLNVGLVKNQEGGYTVYVFWFET